MEQGSRQVGLYDDAGGLLEEAPPSVRISAASEGEICLLDSHGNILDNHQWNIIGTSLDFSCGEQTFFAREGYGYINLGWYEMLTLHILFEEREVEEPAAAAPSLGFTTLATMKGAVMDESSDIIATLFELKQLEPTVSPRQLFMSGRNVGKSIMGPLINVLFLIFMADTFTSSLLYIKNGNSWGYTFAMNMSLGTVQSLVSGIGIVLAVPLVSAFGALLLGRRS